MHNLLDQILDMDEKELLAFIKEECQERDTLFEADMIDGRGKQALYDFISANFYSDFQSVLHSECQLEPGCSMFPNTQTDDDIEDEMGHSLSRLLD